MDHKVSIVLVFSSIVFVCSSGYAGVTGKYEAFGALQQAKNASSEARTTGMKNFLGLFNREAGQGSSPPLHDTPPSACNCSKC